MNMKKVKILNMTWKFIPWAVIVFFVSLTIILGGMVSKKQSDIEKKRTEEYQAPDNSINVVVQKIIPLQISDKINLPAIIAPWEDLMVTAEVEGLVEDIYVREGDKVVQGEIICKIDDIDNKNNLNNISALFELAKINNERVKKLATTHDVTNSELDESNSQLNELQARLDDAQVKLERCNIKAPIDGILNYLPAKKGLLLKRGDPVAQIVDHKKLKVDVGIPESDVNGAKNVTECDISIEALDNMIVKGKKIFLAIQPGSIARLYNLRLVIDNINGQILPGMFARVNIVKRIFNSAIVIPLYSVISRENEHIVFTEEKGIARMHKVKLGIMDNWKIQITEGLSIGDNLIVVGHRSLEDGQKVKVLKIVSDPSEIAQ
jgi:membrane fusion protein, multidrug efflux system